MADPWRLRLLDEPKLLLDCQQPMEEPITVLEAAWLTRNRSTFVARPADLGGGHGRQRHRAARAAGAGQSRPPFSAPPRRVGDMTWVTKSHSSESRPVRPGRARPANDGCG